MFILKSLGSMVLVQIPSGQLWRVNPPNSKVAKELLFKDSTTHHRSNQRPPKLSPHREAAHLLWMNPTDDSKSTAYEFVAAPSTTESTVSAVEIVIYNCMFERRSGKDHTDVTDEELDAYVKFVKASSSAASSKLLGAAKPSAPAAEPTTSRVGPGGSPLPRKTQAQPREEDLHTPARSSMSTASALQTPMAVTPDVHAPDPVTPPSKKGKDPVQNSASPALPTIGLPKGEEILRCTTELYLYDGRVSEFLRLKEVVEAAIIKSAPYEFFLVVSEAGRPYICQPIDSHMNAQFNQEQHAFLWLWREDGSDLCYPWSLKFSDAEDEEEFRSTFGACMYETSNQSPFDKVDEKDKDYVLSAFDDDVEMKDTVDSEDEEEETDEEEELPAVRSPMVQSPAPGDKTAKISQLALGHRDRSFFVRGNSIGVLRHNENNDLEYSTVINNVSSPSKGAFTPKKALLYDGDTSMLMMKPDDAHNVFRMDLNVGKVVEEWNIHPEKKVHDIIGGVKNSSESSNLIGINNNAIFRIDPRLSGQKWVDSDSDIRLYNKINIRAKTHLPGLGDPIIGIDTTDDGKWIVATCKTYLLLVNTEVNDKTGKTISGFTKSLGDSKPAPKRLQLKPQHSAFIGGAISFTPARFNTGADDYGKYDKTVVADDFMFGQDNNIVVALPDDIYRVSKNKLLTPAKMMKSRNSIVNSPF
ncbi:VID27 cytoplasmic protein-domain-containing protein [Zopfochytrium polystomum]|nr:VID27 cytoplasmic protein-domain-containing protein [Zopfochytrium polystomum]